MACNLREYITNQNAAAGLPSVPTSPDDFGGIQRLLESLRNQVNSIITGGQTGAPVIQGADPNAPDTGVLPTPTTLVLTTSGLSPLSLSWDVYPDRYASVFSYFKVYRNLINSYRTSSVVATTPATRFVDSGIATGTAYYYWITAVTNDGRESPASDVASGTFNGFDATDLDVAQLSDIVDDLGSIVAGSITGVVITGSTIQTSASGQRVAIDSANGLRAYDSGGTLQTQLWTNGVIETSALGALSGTLSVGLPANAEIILTAGTLKFYSANTLYFTFGPALVGSNGAEIRVPGLMEADSLNLLSGDVTVVAGQGLTNGSESVLVQGSRVGIVVSGTLVGKFDDTSHATNTGFYLYHNGSLKQVTVDASNFLKV